MGCRSGQGHTEWISKHSKHTHTHKPTHSYTTGTCTTIHSVGCQSGQGHTESVSATNTHTCTHTHKPTHSYTTGTCRTLRSAGCRSGQVNTEWISNYNKHKDKPTHWHNRHLSNTTPLIWMRWLGWDQLCNYSTRAHAHVHARACTHMHTHMHKHTQPLEEQYAQWATDLNKETYTHTHKTTLIQQPLIEHYVRSVECQSEQSNTQQNQ